MVPASLWHPTREEPRKWDVSVLDTQPIEDVLATPEEHAWHGKTDDCPCPAVRMGRP